MNATDVFIGVCGTVLLVAFARLLAGAINSWSRSTDQEAHVGASQDIISPWPTPTAPVLPASPKPKRKRKVKNRYPDFSIGAGDDVDLLVCADYLEDRGRAQEAAWMRLAVEELHAINEMREALAVVKYGRMTGVVPTSVMLNFRSGSLSFWPHQWKEERWMASFRGLRAMSRRKCPGLANLLRLWRAGKFIAGFGEAVTVRLGMKYCKDLRTSLYFSK